MKVTDLKFEMVGCCGTHSVAKVNKKEGVKLGITQLESGNFNVNLYNADGLIGRKLNITDSQLQELLV